MKNENIYAELTFILEQIPYSYNKLIPEEIKKKLKDKMSLEHYNSFDKSKTFYDQNISEDTLKMLVSLYNKYWANEDNNFENI